MKILIVDDEKEIADLIEVYLKNEGYETVKCFTGSQALEKVKQTVFDLAILDVMLPDADGFSICSFIRQKYKYPVIMLTARTQDIDKITGLTLGADDYITKPFNPLELTARVKAHLRRYTQYNTEKESESLIELHGLTINTSAIFLTRRFRSRLQNSAYFFSCAKTRERLFQPRTFLKRFGAKNILTATTPLWYI